MVELQEIEKQAKEKLRNILDQNPIVYSDFQSHIRCVIVSQISFEKSKKESERNLPLRDFKPFTSDLITGSIYSSLTNQTFAQFFKEYGGNITDNAAKKIAEEDDYYPTAEEYQRALERVNKPSTSVKNFQKSYR